ncbi:hypothetical protein A6E05_16415 [Aliivibrio sp. 1S165]|uniref:restriction endonuclease subunit S n=1 Tax=unclassified Aliivibrio TaxID=2645654 RepID=UPI00080E9834|nr:MULTISPECIES: restriction endonuclease subunit S [unclassified Aliivibrio]OCH16466.1 hypothetical protein A6E05_16415 [Aliivibrio sp. 1S165]OCH33903.1 hypothetical protein A6E06_17045 [Aliivibrio sp. 1S175]
MSSLPKGWVGISISDVADVKGGKRLPKGGGFSEVETSYPYIRVSDFDNGTVNTQKLKFIDRETHLAISNYVISSNDLYISIAGTIGLVGDIPKTLDGANLTENAAKLCNLHILNKDFLKYFLQSPSALQQFIDKTTSSGQPKLALFRIKDCSLGLAPLAEQKRIVEKLDEVLAQVDTIKARLDGIPSLLKRFRQSVLASAVSGKLIAVKTPSLMTIGDVSEDIRYGTSKKCDYKGGDTPVIRIPNIGDRKLDISDLKSADFTEKELEKLALKSGDLLVIRSNGSLDLVAKPALVESQYEGFLYAGYLIRIRCDREKVIPSFLLNVLSSRVVRNVVELGARSTSGVNNINSKELSALEFVLPSLEEQKEIVRLVDQYFAFADTIEAQVKKAQARVNNLTQSILAKAFRGELVPQDPNDEPADKLLERIAQARSEAEALAKATKKALSAKNAVKKKAQKV